MNENVKVNNYGALYFAIMSVQNVTYIQSRVQCKDHER
jgi:hypothetical protein